MKNIPFFIKFLGGSVLFVFAGILVFSTYINLFLLESIANTLSQITKTRVDVNSIDVGFREGLVLKINDLKIHSNYKNRKLFSAKEVSAVITYSSLFSENIKIKKSYVRQPNVYLQNLLHEYEKLFPGFYLRKMIGSYITNDKNLVESFKNNKSYGKLISINLPSMSGSNLLPIESKNSSKNIVHVRMEKKLQNIVIHSVKSIKSVEVVQARILSEEAKSLFLLDGLSGSFRVRILNSKKEDFNLEIDKVNFMTEKYGVKGKILAENLFSEDALIQTDVVFFSSHIVDGVKIKFQLPLKNVDNFESLVRHIDLTGLFFTRNLGVPYAIVNSHIPTLEMRFELRKGMVSYNFAAVCPKGYAQKIKFAEGVITFKGTGSLNVKNETHITLMLNPHFRVNDCESPDYFKWLNKLSKLKVFKEQNFISTNAHGTASLTIDYLLPTKDFSARGSLNIKDLILLAPSKNTKRNPREIQILSITDNRITLSLKNKELTFKTDDKFLEGDIGSHGAIDFSLSISNGFLTIKNISMINRFLSFSSQGQLNIIDKTLLGELNFIQKHKKEKRHRFILEGFSQFGGKL